MPVVKMDCPIAADVPVEVIDWMRSVMDGFGESGFTASRLIRLNRGGEKSRIGRQIRTLMDRLGCDFRVRREELG